jgi:small subunit ribosomal protein S7
MARRAAAIKRKTIPDARYNNVTVSRFINNIMKCGKKGTSEKIVYGALDIVEQKEGKPPISVLEQAMRNVTPLLEVKARRVGGATYQVPVDVRADRGMALAMRWLLAAAHARGGKTMADKLAAEITDASKGQGTAIKKREDTHKMAEANRAFAHFRW